MRLSSPILQYLIEFVIDYLLAFLQFAQRCLHRDVFPASQKRYYLRQRVVSAGIWNRSLFDIVQIPNQATPDPRCDVM